MALNNLERDLMDDDGVLFSFELHHCFNNPPRHFVPAVLLGRSFLLFSGKIENKRIAAGWLLGSCNFRLIGGSAAEAENI